MLMIEQKVLSLKSIKMIFRECKISNKGERVLLLLHKYNNRVSNSPNQRNNNR